MRAFACAHLSKTISTHERGHWNETLLFDSDALDLDEAGRVGGLEPAEFVHGRLLLVVQTLCFVHIHVRSRDNDSGAHLFRVSSLDDHVPLEQFQTDDAVDGPLAGRNRARHEFTFGREKMAIVENTTELDRDELVTERTDVAIEGETLEIDVCHAKDGRAGGLVAAPGFHADKPVFDDIDPSDTVFPREGVEREEDLDGVGVRRVGGGDLGGDTGFELDGDLIGCRGGVFDGLGELPHVYGRGGVGILEDAGFVGDVEEVFVRGPGLGGGLLDGDVLFGGEREQGLTTGETVVELCGGGVSRVRWVASGLCDVPGRRHGAMTLMSGLSP